MAINNIFNYILTFYARSFVLMNRALSVCLTTITLSTLFWFLFASLLSCWATATDTRLDCLFPMGNKCEVFLSRTQQRIASLPVFVF